MQSVLSRIWTHVVVSISYDDNHLHHGHLHDDRYVLLVNHVHQFLRLDGLDLVIKKTEALMLKCIVFFVSFLIRRLDITDQTVVGD